jgi:hypothetical protein
MVTASAVAIRTCSGEMFAIGLRAIFATERWRSRSRRQKNMIQTRGRPATCVHRLVRQLVVTAAISITLGFCLQRDSP